MRVGERELIPVARIVTYGRARGTVGRDRIGGWGWGFARVTPLAVVVKDAEGERRIAFAKTAGGTLRVMLGATLVMALLFTAIRWLIRRQRGSGV